MNLLEDPAFLDDTEIGPCVKVTLAQFQVVCGLVDAEWLRDTESLCASMDTENTEITRLFRQAVDAVDAFEAKTATEPAADSTPPDNPNGPLRHAVKEKEAAPPATRRRRTRVRVSALRKLNRAPAARRRNVRQPAA